MFVPSPRALYYLSLTLILAFTSCEDTTNVGSEVFNPDDLEILYTEDVDLIATTTKVDSFKSFYGLEDELVIRCKDGSLPTKSSSLPSLYYLGDLDDPRIGQSKSSIYANVFLRAALPDYSNSTLDSMVLVLAYDTTNVYGDITQPFDVEIYRVLEDFVEIDEAYNNTEFLLSEEPIGSRQNVRFSTDSLRAFLPGRDTSLAQAPGIRIPFDPPMRGESDLPTELFEHPDANTDNDLLNDLLKGLYFTTSSDNNVLVGIEFITANLAFSSTVQMFYTDKTDGTKSMYEYLLAGKRINHINNNTEGSEADIAANGGSEESLHYVSGQDGYDVHIDISDLKRFEDFAINKAVLEFTLAEPIGIEGIQFPPSDRLIISQLGDNNELLCIDDIVIGTERLGTGTGGLSIGSLFGGVLEEVEENGTVLRKYSMSVTSHIQSYLEGEASSTLVLSVSNRSENPRRSVLYGPDHSTNPAKLKLTYTAP